jgi:hypothetical protein
MFAATKFQQLPWQEIEMSEAMINTSVLKFKTLD